jgi:hypothetical protein
MLEDSKPRTRPTIVVEVEIRASELMNELAKCYLNELTRVAGCAGDQLLEGVSRAKIRGYLATLSWMRVIFTTDVRDSSYNLYHKLRKKLAVPVLAYQFLIGIGEATDHDYGIRFVPVATIDEKDLLSPDEMRELSDLFFSLQNSGFKVVAGIPQDPDGQLDFMAMSHVETITTSYRKTHPVYGFLASFFAQLKLNETVGPMCRIVYGYDSDYAANLAKLVAVIGGGD